MKQLVFLFVPLMAFAQVPILVESFSPATFPPVGWDTTRSDSAMGYWLRYQTSGAAPDSHHARVLVYNRYDSLRRGFSELVTHTLDLSGSPGVETLSFWFRFSANSSNLGPDDSLSVSISHDDVNWDCLWAVGQSGQSNEWTIVDRSLATYDNCNSVRLRFRYEDRPNGGLGTQNRYFWLDSVKVVSYGVGVGEEMAQTFALNEMLMIYPNPARNRIELKLNLATGHRTPRGGSAACSPGSPTKGIELKIYDSTGRSVRSFMLPAAYSLLPSVVWDGTDQSGRFLPAGVYCCEMQAGGQPARRMIILVR